MNRQGYLFRINNSRSGHRALAAGAAALLAGGLVLAAPASALAATGSVSLTQQQLSQLQALVDSDPGAYAGLWVDSKTGIAHLDSSDGSLTANAAARALPTADGASAAWRLEIDPAKYSGAQLGAVESAVTGTGAFKHALAASGAQWSTVGVDPTRDQVEIGVTKITKGLQAAVEAQFGEKAYLTVQRTATSTVAQVPNSQLAKFLSHAARPSHVAINPQDRGTSSNSDVAPWYGGDLTAYVQGGTTYICTLGYEFADYTMSTAGHCGSTSQAFYQLTNGASQGSTISTQWGNGRIDLKKIDGSTYSPYIWTSSTASVGVSGYTNATVGMDVCTDGAVTGQSCGLVTDVNITVNDTSPDGTAGTTFQDEITSGSVLCSGGDSGGPAYKEGTATAVGTISSESDGGKTCFINDMKQITHVFGDGPKTA